MHAYANALIKAMHALLAFGITYGLKHARVMARVRQEEKAVFMPTPFVAFC
jgi:hypothetical protein